MNILNVKTIDKDPFLNNLEIYFLDSIKFNCDFGGKSNHEDCCWESEIKITIPFLKTVGIDKEKLIIFAIEIFKNDICDWLSDFDIDDEIWNDYIFINKNENSEILDNFSKLMSDFIGIDFLNIDIFINTIDLIHD